MMKMKKKRPLVPLKMPLQKRRRSRLSQRLRQPRLKRLQYLQTLQYPKRRQSQKSPTNAKSKRPQSPFAKHQKLMRMLKYLIKSYKKQQVGILLWIKWNHKAQLRKHYRLQPIDYCILYTIVFISRSIMHNYVFENLRKRFRRGKGD